MNYFLGSLLGLLVIACTLPIRKKSHEPNVCLLPNVRDVRIHPTLANAGWVEPILWAFDRWKQVVPDLSYQLIVSDQASEDWLDCATSFVPYTFTAPEYELPVWGDTREGFVRIGHPFSLNEPEARKALILHELGHLLFGFGHTKDMTSIMFPVIQANPHLSFQDESKAKAAFLQRDGSIS